MILTVDTGIKKDLTAAEMASLESKLRNRFPKLVGWTYSPLTGELSLDFGEYADEQFVKECESEGRRKRVEFLGAVREWEG